MKTNQTKPIRSSMLDAYSRFIGVGSRRLNVRHSPPSIFRLPSSILVFLLPLLPLLLLPAVVHAEDYTYTTNDGTITITKYTGSGGAVTIPGTINGLPVTSIGQSAFYYCGSLASVTIPNSVTNIGNNAFFCCTSLTSITIPNSVTSIGGWVFIWCSSLSVITVDTTNPAYSSVDGVLFDKSQIALVLYPAGKVGSSYTIPNSVTSIGDSAFWGCTSLASVTIPNSVTNILPNTFSECASLSVITVVASNPVYSSVDGVLFNKNQTAILLYPAGKAGSQYTIPNSVTKIGGESFVWPGAFYGCTNLTNITIPNSVTSIGDSAFGECTSLTSVTIPDSVISIGNSAFRDCTSLTSITIPNSVTSIGGGAFQNCTSLTSITIPDSVSSIGGRSMFWGGRSRTVPA